MPGDYTGENSRSDMTSWSFTVAVPAQRDEIARLIDVAFTPYVRQLGYDKPNPFPWLEPAISANQIQVVCDENGGILAAIYCTRAGDVLKIEELAVDPQHHGQGLGGWVLARIEKQAKSQGATSLTLFTGATMAPLLRFYRANGFIETHRAPPEHGDDPHLRAYFRKDI